MSSTILRRNSSKQGLQNLLRVTAQRSIEDAEEVERERRRRARESFRSGSSMSGPGGPSQDNGTPTEDDLDLKPSSSPSLEEDEGFSDWTQRLEKRRQQRMEELNQGQEEKNKVAYEAAEMSENTLSVTAPTSFLLQRKTKDGQEDEEKKLTWKTSEKIRKTHEEETLKEERAQRDRQRGKEREREAEKLQEEQIRVLKKKEKGQKPEVGMKRQEIKVSYTSKVFVHQEAKQNMNENAPREEVTSRMVKTKRTPRPVVQAGEAGEAEEAEAILETERRLEKIRRSHQEKESQELEQLRHRQVQAELELEELNRRREERRRVREEEERRKEEEEQQRLAKEEEEKRRMKEDIERRRMEAAERMKTLSTSGMDREEMFSPLSPKSPTYKITKRTESLNRSLKKSSFKKTLPPVLLSKMDDRLEQYTHAIETSQEAKGIKQAVVDIPTSPEAVASKKNLFEAGEAWSQSPTKGTPCKDAEGLKVGVADLITQWVRGNPDDSGKQSLSKPSDVKPGDVMQKKNMWEIIGDASSWRHGLGAKGTPSGKRYKFIVTGHGKYEKIPVDDESAEEYTNGNEKSDLCPGEF